MEQDLFQLLPSEITFDILSRLHVRAIATSKCVCKSWLNLLETDDLVKFHLSKSVPALAVSMAGEDRNSVLCKVFEFDDDNDDHRYNPLTNFDLPLRLDTLAAADGLLLLLENYGNYGALYICNPTTREYVKLRGAVVEKHHEMSYGFGVSKITGQHKVVAIIHEPDSCNCCVNVYILETGLWRRFEAATAELQDCYYYSSFVNGRLHWMGMNGDITCFDLETECFSTLSAAPRWTECDSQSICVLKDYLSVCYAMLHGFDLEVWLMKEYGVVNSWTKEHVIGSLNFPTKIYEPFLIIKVFKNGDILISGLNYFRDDSSFKEALWHYSSKTQTAHIVGMLQPPGGSDLSSLLFTPSFLSLKRNLGMEHVISF